MSASARPPVLCLGIENQNVLGNIKLFLEGHNYSKLKQSLRTFHTIIQDEVCCYDSIHYSPMTHVSVLGD